MLPMTSRSFPTGIGMNLYPSSYGGTNMVGYPAGGYSNPVSPKSFVGPNPKYQVLDPAITKAVLETGAPPLGTPEARSLARVALHTTRKSAYGQDALLSLSEIYGPKAKHVVLDEEFLRRLPPTSIQPWMRRVNVRGSTYIGAIGKTYTTIANLQKGQALVIMNIQQFWMDAGLDPFDPDVLQSMQSQEDAYGRVYFNLLANNRSPFDISQSLTDPDGGLYTPRNVNGFTTLNENLLYIGIHPTAVYIGEASTLTAQWTTLAVPGHIPAVIGVQLDGYVVSAKYLDGIVNQVRSPFFAPAVRG